MNELEEEQWDAPQRPQTEKQFQIMMHSLDEFLSKHDVKPFAKSFNAKIEICRAYKLKTLLDIPSYMEYLFANDLPFSDQNLLKRCEKWYEDNLGDRAKNFILLGEYAFLLRNQFWKVRVPVIFGGIALCSERDLSINFNILNDFEDLTQTYANSLTDFELCEIEDHYLVAYEALSTMNYLNSLCIKSKIFLEQAHSDFISSVDALISINVTYGKSRRDTATCCEKIMKAILSEKNINYQSNHKLEVLASSLNSDLGMHIDLNLIKKIHTKADVSYDKEVSKTEAYEAHKNLLIFLKKLQNDVHTIFT